MTSHWLLLLRHLNDPGVDLDPAIAARAAADIVLRQQPPPPDLIEAVMSTAATNFAAAVTVAQARHALHQAAAPTRGNLRKRVAT
jgi:hypothetical protein